MLVAAAEFQSRLRLLSRTDPRAPTPGVLAALGTEQPLSAAALERQIEAAAEAEREKQAELQAARLEREMLLVLLR